MMLSRLQFVILASLVALTSAFTVLPGKSTASAAPQYTSISTYRSMPQETDAIRMAGPATLEPETIEKEDIKEEDMTKSESTYKRGGWAVRLFNDPMNKREFVAMCLSKITGLSDGQAYQVMMQAHQNGVSVVGRYDQERAELYRDSLRDHGLVVDMIPVEDD